MEHHQDERIVCVSCGNSFLFTAVEAARYEERGLVAPPRRCRDCRRARQEQRGESPGAMNGQARPHGGGRRAGGPSYGDDNRGNRLPAPSGNRMPAHSGNVNEYRSPMQDTYQLPTFRRAPERPQARGPRSPSFQSDNAYRAPAFRTEGEPTRSRGPKGPSARGEGSPRREPRAKFTITCKACGAESQVPFKPDEGRDVFCQACYRARKPS